MRPATAASMLGLGYANVNAFAGCNIGVPCSPLEAVTSLDPKDYVWGAPSPQQQQLLFQQFLQMHFLHHLHMSQHNSAMAGAPISMLLHPSQIPASQLTAHPHCAIIPGLAAMPGFLTAGQHLAAHQLAVATSQRELAAPSQPAPAPSQIAPSQAPSKARGSGNPVVKKEEPAPSSKTSVTPVPKPAPVPTKSTAFKYPSNTTPDTGVNSAGSGLDKDGIFDCVGALPMDVTLLEHDYTLESGVKDQVAAKPVVVKKEEAELRSKAATTPASKLGPVLAVQIPAPESPSIDSPSSAVNSTDSALSYLDKDDIFGHFQMDMFDEMLSEHCNYDLETSVEDQASTLCGTASVPSPSSSNGSIVTVAGAPEAAACAANSNENLTFLQGSVDLAPFPEDCGIGAFDYAAGFDDVADFEFTDLDSMVGLTGVDLGCDMTAFDAPQPCGNAARTPTSGQLKVKKVKHPVSVSKGSGVQKPTSRRCGLKNAGALAAI